MMIRFANTKFKKVFRNIMRDKDLSIESKAIYSYFISFTNSIFIPEKEVIAYELNISIDSLNKYIKELEDKGILEVWE